MNAKPVSYCSSWLVLLLLVACQQHLANATKKRAHSSDMVPCALPVDITRLPSHIQPQHYEVHLDLDPRKNEFEGKVRIKLKIREELDHPNTLMSRSRSRRVHPFVIDRKRIILNSEDLDVYGGKVYFWNRKRSDAESICYDRENKIIVIEMKEAAIFSRVYTLFLSFRGTVGTEAKGLFKNSVHNVPLLATNLEPNFARRLFPCFDDPEFKTTFELTILHPQETTVVSNVISHQEPASSHPTHIQLKTSFEYTQKVSTFMLGFAVTKFHQIEYSVGDGTQISIYVPKRLVSNYLNSMLEKAKQAFEAVSRFFHDIQEPPKKIEIVALNMKSGVMGVYGLIFMNWELLCTPEDMLKPEDRSFAVTALTNMMVSFWLGNLVTVHWWDELWFIKGLASYVTSELTREEFPELSSELYTLMDITYSAMKSDDDPRQIQPIHLESLQIVEDIREFYDSSNYKKSEALFMMFAYFVGSDKFKSVIYDFIQSNAAIGLVNAENFWFRLEEITPDRYKTALQNVNLWTQQTGYPIIVVSMTSNNQLLVSQQSNLGDGKFWQVPITYEIHYGTRGGKKRERFVLSDLTPKEIGLPVDFHPESGFHWLQLNIKNQGYYRVVYESPLREALVHGLNSGRMLPVDRVQLLSDSYAHAMRSGSLYHFEELVKFYVMLVDQEDGVILMLTTILIDMYENNIALSYIKEVEEMLLLYYHANGYVWEPADSNVLKQFARAGVLFYLVAFLKNDIATQTARNYIAQHGGLPTLFKRVERHLLKTN